LNTTAPGAAIPTFAGQQTFPSGPNPLSVAVGDFNGDGKPDLSVASEGSNTVSVLSNATAPGATTPSFETLRAFATGQSPRSVAVGDFNQDGGPDLAVVNDYSNTVSVLLNTTAPITVSGSPATGTIQDDDNTVHPTHLVFGVQPNDTIAGSAITPAVTVRVEDASNNVVTGDNSDQVTIAIGANPGDGTLSGALILTVHNGVATFSDLSIDKSGAGYTLSAASSGLTGATSNGFNITPAAADHLFLLQQPTNTVAGEAITPAIEVEIVDRFGNLTSSTANVSLAIGANPGGGVLSGTTTEVASGGIAAFGDLSINKTGLDYMLAVSSSGLTGVTSNGFNITPAAADHMFFLQQPRDATAGQIIAPPVRVEILDRFGNLTPSTAGVSVAIGANPAGGTLSGTTTAPASGGVATFADSAIDNAGTGYTLAATSSGLPDATSNGFNVVPAGANHPPVLDPIPDLGLSLGKSLTFTAHATDPDSPPQTLTFSLDPGAPAGARIDPSTGVLTVSNLKFGTYTLAVRVTDNGSPALSTVQTFHVLVAPQVKDITRNDGSVKNPTAVTFLTVTFNTRVNIDSGTFELTRLGSGGGPVGVAVASVNVINGKTVVTLQFSGSFVLPDGSLMSGQYALTAHGSLIHDAVTGLALDGDNDGLPGGDNVFGFSVS
jgi:hypothetical protein